VIESIRNLAEEVEENEYLLKAEFRDRDLVAFRSGRFMVEAKSRDHAEEVIAEVVGV